MYNIGTFGGIMEFYKKMIDRCHKHFSKSDNWVCWLERMIYWSSCLKNEVVNQYKIGAICISKDCIIVQNTPGGNNV